MKKVLIIAKGEKAQIFLERLIATYVGSSHYDVIYYDDSINPDSGGRYFNYHRADPTSPTRISKIYSPEHIQVNIFVDEPNDIKIIYSLIRRFDKRVPINIVDEWGLDIKDDFLSMIDTKMLIANRVVALLPDVPVVAQHIGLGRGEIMEIQVPVGSSYAYRHIISIEQKKWKIAAIYRSNHTLLAKPSFIIKPNDILLAVGDPVILKNVYKAIKAQIGQFPLPYGRNIYYILDANEATIEQKKNEIHNAISLHKRLNSKTLYIRVVNPQKPEFLDYITSFDSRDVEVRVNYRHTMETDDFAHDIEECHGGLVVVNDEFFSDKKNRKMLYSTEKAVCRLADTDINKVEKGGLVIGSNQYIENIAAPMFDITSQLAVDLTLYNITPDFSDNEESIEYFENLSVIYERKIDVVKKRANPVRELSKEENILHVLPFSAGVINDSFMDVLKVGSVEKQHRFLKKFHQIFIPVQDRENGN